MSFYNASVLEIVWVVISLFGTFYTFRNAYEARLDLHAVQEAGVTNGRLVFASAAMRIEMVRCTGMTLWLMAGLVASLHPTPSPPMWRMVTLSCLIGGVILTVVNSVMDRRARSKVIAAVRAKRSRHGVVIEPDEQNLRALAALTSDSEPIDTGGSDNMPIMDTDGGSD